MTSAKYGLDCALLIVTFFEKIPKHYFKKKKKIMYQITSRKYLIQAYLKASCFIQI